MEPQAAPDFFSCSFTDSGAALLRCPCPTPTVLMVPFLFLLYLRLGCEAQYISKRFTAPFALQEGLEQRLGGLWVHPANIPAHVWDQAGVQPSSWGHATSSPSTLCPQGPPSASFQGPGCRAELPSMVPLGEEEMEDTPPLPHLNPQTQAPGTLLLCLCPLQVSPLTGF